MSTAVTDTSAEIRRTPLPLVSAPVHLGIALAVAVAVGAAWIGAERVSEKAVQSAARNITNSPIYVTLPAVQVVSRRKAADPASRPAT